MSDDSFAQQAVHQPDYGLMDCAAAGTTPPAVQDRCVPSGCCACRGEIYTLGTCMRQL
jgi:hypothetical protein